MTPAASTIEALWQRLRTLSDRQKAGLLAYLCGWCKDDKTFAAGLDVALHQQFPELFVAPAVQQ